MLTIGTVSGIMIDGVDVGEDTILTCKCEGENKECLYCNGEGFKRFFHQEPYRQAELICVHTVEVKRSGGELGRSIFVVYDNNKIMSAFLPQSWYPAFIGEYGDKIVMCEQKPFILNGDSNGYFYLWEAN